MPTQISQPLQATQAWLQNFVIAYNICPFAKHPNEQGRIHYIVQEDADLEACLLTTVLACEQLRQNSAIETTLIILSNGFSVFADFLELLYSAEDLLIAQGYEGEFQLASFHPQYQFADAALEDPANYTNRSPYPMLHVIREASITAALAHYPEPEAIPQNNIKQTRQLGIRFLQQLLSDCSTSKS